MGDPSSSLGVRKASLEKRLMICPETLEEIQQMWATLEIFPFFFL